MRFISGCNHPTSALPWKSLLPHLLALHILHPGSAQFRVVAPRLHVMATVGQDVVLRCHLSPCKDARSLDIRWIQDRSSGLVHHYQDGVVLKQMEEYKGRTELLRDGLSDGNLDLRITDVTSSDSSSYSCILEDVDGYAEAVVNLEVSDPFSQIIHSWAAALAVVLTLLLGSFVIIAFLHRKQVAQHRELKRKDAQLAEQAAILEKLAAELVKRTKEVEKKNSQLKKHCEDMEEQRKKSKNQNSQLNNDIKNMGISAADLKKQAAKLEKQTEKVVEYTEYLEYWNSLLKHSLKMMGFSAADFMKEVAELEEHCEEMKMKDAKLVKQVAKLVKRTKEVENRNSLLKKHCEDMEAKDPKLEKLAAKQVEQTEPLVVEMKDLDKQTEESD